MGDFNMEKLQTEKEIRELVEKASSGDRESIGTLLKTFTSDMYFITRLYVGDKETARSSEQTALRSALRNLRDSVSAESFEEWLSDIVRNTALQNIPAVEVRKDADLKYTNKDEIPDTSLQLPDDKDECKIRILHALDALPSSERAAAALRYYDLMSLDEIGDKLNISKDETRKLLASAKQILANGDTGVSALLALASKVNPRLAFDEEAAVAAQEPEEDILEAGGLSLDELFDEAESRNGDDTAANLNIPEEPEEEEGFKIHFDEPEEQEEDPFGNFSFENETPAQEEKNSFFDIPDEIDPEPTKVVESVNQIVYPAEDDDDDDYEEKPRKKGGFLKWFLPLLLIAALAGGAFYLFGIKGYTIDDIKSLIPGMGGKPAETATPEPTPEATATPTPTPAPTPTPTPTPEPTPEGEPVIGQATINVMDLTIRNGAGVSFEYVDLAEPDATYDVYETAEADGYTWYRIGENQWVPSDGTWIAYTPKE